MDSMRYIFVPNQLEIPEWKECYYDSETLEEMIEFVKDTQSIYSRIKKQIMQNNLKEQHSSTDNQSLMRAKLNMRKILLEWNQLFYRYSDKQAKIIYMFIQLKSFEIRGKFILYRKIIKILPYSDQRMLLLLQNLYIEAFYTNNAINFNIAKEKSTIKKYYREISMYSQFNYDLRPNSRLIRMRQQMNSLLSKIEFDYVRESQSRQKTAQKRLKKIGAGSATINLQHATVIGIIIGLIIMLGCLIDTYRRANDINLQNNQIFRAEFPVWRGGSYALFYLWVIGFDVLFYEASQINYKMIFRFSSQNIPHARFIFFSASVLTLIYLLLFILFVVTLSGDISSTFYKYGEIFWLIVLIYILIPIPWRGSMYFLKTLRKVVLSPCIKITFLMIWVTEQFVSLSQPFGDLFYTICHLIQNDAPKCTSLTPNFTTSYILIVLFYRMVQNLKFWHQNTQASASKQYNFQAPPFLGFVRGFFGFNTGIAALLFRLKVFETAFQYWLVMSIMTTLVSWLVDLKGDWGLLGFQHKFLREKLLFTRYKFAYYSLGIMNLALRTAWVLSISPFVVNSIGFLPFIFIMIISYIEIVRRGIWNILRIQFEHIKNCNEFRATIDDSKIFKKVKQRALELKKQQLDKKMEQQRKYCEKSVYIEQGTISLIQMKDEEISHHKISVKEQILAEIKEIQEMDELEDTRMKKQTVLFKQFLRSRRQLKELITEKQVELESRIQKILNKNKKLIEVEMSEQNDSDSEPQV